MCLVEFLIIIHCSPEQHHQFEDLNKSVLENNTAIFQAILEYCAKVFQRLSNCNIPLLGTGVYTILRLCKQCKTTLMLNRMDQGFTTWQKTKPFDLPLYNTQNWLQTRVVG